MQFIINSLASQYGLFQINYNTIKDKQSMNELQTMLIQEEAKLKKQRTHLVNLMDHKGVEKA